MVRTKMPLQADEELGKKDDDHRFPEQERFRHLRHPKMPRPRRLVAVLIAIVLLYQFFKYMPTDLTPAAERYNPTIAKLRHQNAAPPPGSVQTPAIPKLEVPLRGVVQGTDNPEGLYDGEIKFYELARSLPHHKHPDNTASRAVVFAGSSLRGISDMIPLACRMARKQLNHVHFALLGKDEVSIEGIKQVNGVTDPECPMTWHDSRPDYSAQSTDSRMERSVAAGLAFIRTYIAPEVIITHRDDSEDHFFRKGIAVHKKETGIPHVTLPAPSIDLMWLADVDSTALRVWNDIRVDIVVHASESSGSLIRLIRSLDAADYLGSTPSLTIELSPRVDSQTLDILQHLDGLSQLTGRINLRRRIQSHHMDLTEASLRIVESFYPLNPHLSHLLLLSPRTELAPSFYHYLKYSILVYKHSARAQPTSLDLLGISLELPSLKPTAEDGPFNPPQSSSSDHIGEGGQEYLPSFLWQAPNSNAALYFGDKWAEFHAFLSDRLAIASKADSLSQDKLISRRYPAFMEYLLEMMRAKGYCLLYPSFPGVRTSSIATVHSELYQVPEEFAYHGRAETPNQKSVDDIDDLDEPFQPPTNDAELLSASNHPSRASTIMALLDMFELGLPEVKSLPLLAYDGELLTAEEFTQQTKAYVKEFRSRHGKCTQMGETVDDFSENLFCFGE
ncbi:uncharacterized protein N7459_003084 [Penicillium hispanicum]|uniref:uncharacterized protein n=1 Tax=Penicillium hispanicum TaxID=1080232 RepID=UPI0025408DC0|nr:uncharacterized protein N7459_003084 [Penicillium hispanicum]KAJ5587319.1 hypothetical protein N7459_003084 [Penicillium hispanicum]